MEREVTVFASVVRAAEMRYSVGKGWSEWQPYASFSTVTLLPVEGLQFVRMQFRDVNGVTREYSDDVYYNAGPPAVPQEPTATPVLGRVKLTWPSGKDSDLAAYRVYRATSASGPYKMVAEIPAVAAFEGEGETPPVNYLSGALTKGMTYHFKVSAVDNDGLVSKRSAARAAKVGAVARRYAGATSYSTAIAASRAHFSAVDTVVLTRQDRPLDQLAAASLAGSHGSPILFVSSTGIGPSTLAELRRLGADRAILVGGTQGLADSIAADVGTSTAVSRVAGADSYGTAAAVARELASGETTPAENVFLVNAARPADALAAVPLAYAQGVPILFTQKSKVPSVTRRVIDDLDFEQLTVLGDSRAVDEQGLESSLPWMMPDRIEGGSAYSIAAAAAQIADESDVASFGVVAIANPSRFSEAVVGGVSVGSRGGLMLLSTVDRVPASTRGAIRANVLSMGRLEIYGGKKTLSSKGYTSLNAAIRWQPQSW